MNPHTPRAEEGEVAASLVSHGLLRSLPTGDEVINSFGGSKRILRVFKRVVEDLDHEHEDEHEYEGGVEVGHIECRSKTSDERVPSNHSCKQHGSQLRGKTLHQAVENGSAGNGQAHHHDQIGEEGKSTEHQMSSLPESGLDDL